MKQEISPKMVVGIIIVAVVLLVGSIWWAWRAPSAPAVADQGVHPHPGGARAMLEGMRAERMGRRQGQAATPQNGTP